MADDREQLVKLITQQVQAALRGQPKVGEPSSAVIHPPLGTCTGDYSKFTELKGKPFSGAPEGTPSSIPALKGIVTAKHLEGRGKRVLLEADARLTPLAMDYVKSQKITVERVSAGGAVKTVAAPDAPWVWWCDGHEPNVERTADMLRDRLKPLSHQRSAGALVSILKELARRVKAGEASGGVLFVESAVKAACYANRSPALRAVVGTGEEAVEQGVRALAANVLILEHPRHGWRTMREMAERFVTSPRSTCAIVERQLREMSA